MIDFRATFATHIPDKAFSSMYEIISMHMRDNSAEAIQELRCEIGLLFIYADIENWNKGINGTTRGQVIAYLKKYSKSIDTLINQLTVEINTIYLREEVTDENGQYHYIDTVPDWLSPLLDCFNVEGLKTSKQNVEDMIANLEARGKKDGGTKRPRANPRTAYVKGLVKIFNEFTNEQTKLTIDKNHSTLFSDFALSFFQHPQLNSRIKINELHTLYREYNNLAK